MVMYFGDSGTKSLWVFGGVYDYGVLEFCGF